MIQLTAFEIQKEQNTIFKWTIQTLVDPEKNWVGTFYPVSLMECSEKAGQNVWNHHLKTEK